MVIQNLFPLLPAVATVTTPITIGHFPELTNYLVQRDSAGAKPFQTIQTLSASSTQYTDPNYAKFISTGIWRIETQWNMNCNALPSGKMNGANAQNTSRSNVRNNYIFTGMSNVHEVAQTVLVYPNPATGLVNIQLNGENKQGTYQVILYNMLGGIVYQSIEEKASTTIDVSPFEKGIYTLCLRTQTNNKVQRLVIMK